MNDVIPHPANPSARKDTLEIQWPPKAPVAGIAVSLVDYEQAVDCIIASAEAGRSAVVSCHAVHAIVTTGGEKSLRDDVNRFSMIAPDGQPVRWALNAIHGADLDERVYGPELMLRVCEAAAEHQVSIYLYGGTPEILSQLRENLFGKFPKLEIAGDESPPFRDLCCEENEKACQRINDSGAGIVLIGLGCPKQDRFAALNRDRIQAVQVCVGAAFDFHAGVKPMAPSWMQKRGLEWAFRLWCEPRRLWRRYLITNTIFSCKVFWQWITPRRRRSLQGGAE